MCVSFCMAQRLHAWLRFPPYYFWVSLLLLAILQTLGILAALYFIRTTEGNSRDSADGVALTSAREMETLLNGQKAALLTVATAIAMVRRVLNKEESAWLKKVLGRWRVLK